MDAPFDVPTAASRVADRSVTLTLRMSPRGASRVVAVPMHENGMVVGGTVVGGSVGGVVSGVVGGVVSGVVGGVVSGVVGGVVSGVVGGVVSGVVTGVGGVVSSVVSVATPAGTREGDAEAVPNVAWPIRRATSVTEAIVTPSCQLLSRLRPLNRHLHVDYLHTRK